MSGMTCSICLENLRSPVATPCGHIHCGRCLTGHINAGSDACQTTCPTCRTPFSIAAPDLAFVPKKYHQFIIPSVRKVYLNTDPDESLHAKVKELEARVKSLDRDKHLLMDRAEAHIARANSLAQRERDARLAKDKAESEAKDWKENYATLNRKYSDLKKRNEAAGNPFISRNKATVRDLYDIFQASNSTDSPIGNDPQEKDTRIIRRLPKRSRQDAPSLADDLGPPPVFQKRPRLAEPQAGPSTAVEVPELNPQRGKPAPVPSNPTGRVPHIHRFGRRPATPVHSTLYLSLFGSDSDSDSSVSDEDSLDFRLPIRPSQRTYGASRIANINLS